MYGLIIVFAILVAALYAEKIAKKQSKNTNILWGALFIGLIFGVIGARLFHVLDLWPYYLQHPTNILKVWYGGLGIFGGILFGGLAGACYLKLKHEPLLPWFDIAALALPLGQALGRFANYANDELLPFALYESALDFALFLILNLVYKYNGFCGAGYYFNIVLDVLYACR